MDNYEAMKDDPFEEEFYKWLVILARERVALGIHLLITAGRQNDLRVALHSNIKNQLTLRQNDSSDVTNIVGNTTLRHTEDIKGWALMARDQVDVVQFYLPFEERSAMALSAAFQQEAQAMADHWTGHLPSAIPMVPEILTEPDLQGRSESLAILKNKNMVLGLDKETVSVTGWNRRYSNLLYLTNRQDHMTKLLDYVVSSSALAGESVFVFSPTYHNLPQQTDYELLSESRTVKEMLAALKVRMDERYKEEAYHHDSLLIFYDFSSFVGDLSQALLTTLASLLDKGRHVGYTIVILSDNGLATKIDAASKVVKVSKQMVIDMRIMDQQIVTAINKPNKETLLGFQEQYFVKDRIAQKLQVTYIGE